MDFAALWDTLAFIIIHVTVFELPLVLIATVASSLLVARVLDKHNARLREARLARRVAAVYAGLLATLIAGKLFLM